MVDARGVYVVAATANTGKSLVTVGLVDLMRTQTDSLASAAHWPPPRPPSTPTTTPLVRLARDHAPPARGARPGGVSRAQARALLAAGKGDELYRRCVGVYSASSTPTNAITRNADTLATKMPKLAKVAMMSGFHSVPARSNSCRIFRRCRGSRLSPSRSSSSRYRRCSSP
jgi:hypothetical protein